MQDTKATSRGSGRGCYGFSERSFDTAGHVWYHRKRKATESRHTLGGLEGVSGMSDAALRMLEAQGVSVADMARLVYKMQYPYNAGLTVAECMESVHMVVRKRDVQYAVITGVTLDRMAEAGTLQEPLGAIIREDNPLFGVDEVLALTIVNSYGSIGLSNYGYLARSKPDFLQRFAREAGGVHTFLDDLAAAIVAAACARIAHRNGQLVEDGPDDPAKIALGGTG